MRWRVQIVQQLGWKCLVVRPWAPDTRGVVAMVIEGGRMQVFTHDHRMIAHLAPCLQSQKSAEVAKGSDARRLAMRARPSVHMCRARSRSSSSIDCVLTCCRPCTDRDRRLRGGRAARGSSWAHRVPRHSERAGTLACAISFQTMSQDPCAQLLKTCHQGCSTFCTIYLVCSLLPDGFTLAISLVGRFAVPLPGFMRQLL